MAPEQVSVAGGVTGTVAEHSPITSGKVATSGTGAVMSSTIIFCIWVEVLPFPSSYVQVIVYVPCKLYISGSEVVPRTVPRQLSVAVGVTVTVAEHSPVTSGNVAISGTGAVISSITTFCV